MRIGVISDTHGLLRDSAIEALRGSDRILHAGDIGDPAILEALAGVAPVDAIRGNNDTDAWATALPDARLVRVGDVAIHLLHDVKQLALYPVEDAVDVIVAGHSHRPSIARDAEGVLWVNPGSAGRRRFKLPISLAILHVDGRDVQATIVELDA